MQGAERVVFAILQAMRSLSVSSRVPLFDLQCLHRRVSAPQSDAEQLHLAY